MPTYDYRCTTCGCRFEHVRAINEVADVSCPGCGHEAKRVFTPVGVVFKGSGFHNTDYRPRPKSEESPAAAKDSCGDAGTGKSCAGCPAAD